ncbi:MAG: hypothetical protein JSR66_22110 [Proteobacteria bacterium]|nr:hypothetical protein [Pseudomonadota bacterium]
MSTHRRLIAAAAGRRTAGGVGLQSTAAASLGCAGGSGLQSTAAAGLRSTALAGH